MSEEVIRKRLLLDSDGVFANYDVNVFNHFGSYPKDMNDDEMWALIKANAEAFWLSMPQMPDAQILWEYVKPFNPKVVTGCPKGHFEIAAALKKYWWVREFEWTDVVCCRAKDKPLHIENPGDVLIDDFVVNVKRHEKAGGIAILHKSAEQTIEKLKSLGF